MSLWVSLPLIASLANVLLIIVVVRSNWRGLLHRILSLFLLALALWSLAVYGVRASPTLEGALLWQRAALGGAATVQDCKPSPE